MRDTARLKEAYERNEKALRLRPSIGRGTVVTNCRMTGDLACEISEGDWKLTSDAPESEGGRDTGPEPGILIRGALGTCCAIGYVLQAARFGVPLDHVEVEVQADYDSNGEYGLAEVTAGWTAVRYIVRVESRAPEADIMRVIEEADRHGNMLEVVRDPVPVTRQVRITAPAEA